MSRAALIRHYYYRGGQGYSEVIKKAESEGYIIPSVEEQALQRNVMSRLQSSGIMSKLDLFVLTGTDGDANFASLNWVNPDANQATRLNPVSHTTKGVKGNGTDSYLNTHFNPSSEGAKFQLNDACVGVYVTEDRSGSFGDALFGFPTSTSGFMRQASTSNERLNGASSLEGGTVSFGGTGYRAINKSAAGTLQLYNSDTKYDRTCTDAAEVPDEDMVILRWVSNYNDARIGAYWAGASLTQAENEDLRDILDEYFAAQSLINLDTFFDSLNLQSNTTDNFTTDTGAIAQWNDLSPAERHATQATADQRPALNTLDPTFDGTDDGLVLATEFASNTYSVYIVLKPTTAEYTEPRTPLGAVSINNYVSFGHNIKQLQINNTPSGGSQKNWGMYGDEYYMVLSIRRNGGLEEIKCNGRTLRSGSTPDAFNQVFGRIGRSTNRFYDGVIKAVCIHSEYVDEGTDFRITQQLLSRYSLPETSDAIDGFGDSITVGTGATDDRTGGWLPLLADLQTKPRKNFGIGSSRLTAHDENSGITRFRDQVIEAPYSDTLIILYGTNDVNANVSADDYENALTNVLNQAINAGYVKAKIYVGTIPYQLGDGDADRIALYNAKISTVTTALGVTMVDIYTAMKNGGGDTLMADDNHPNDDGHALIAETFNAAMS